MRRIVVVTLAVAGGMWIAAPAFASSWRPNAGTVVLLDALSGNDHVRVYTSAAGVPAARAAIVRAATSLRMRNGGLSVDDVDGPDGSLKRVDLSTTIPDRTERFRWTVPFRVLRAFDLKKRGAVVLEVTANARVASPAVRLASDPLYVSYRVTTSSDVSFVLPASFFGRSLGLVLAFVVLPWAVVHPIVRRIRRSGKDDVEKVHALRVTSMITIGVAMIAWFGAFVIGGLAVASLALVAAVAPHVSQQPSVAGLVPPLFLGFAVGTTVIVLRPAQRAYRDLRGIGRRPGDRTKRARLTAALVLPIVVWVVLLSSIASLSPGARIAIQTGGLVALLVLVPIVFVLVAGARRLETEQGRRLLEMCRTNGLNVRGIRVISTRSTKVANAMIIGPFARLSHIVLTDYLLEHFSEREVEAVVAHEIAHGKGHHLLLRLGAWLLFSIVVGGAAIAAAIQFSISPAWVAVGLPVLFLAGFVAVFGGVGVMLERRADRYGARLVGTDAMVDALEKLAEANMAKRRTGWLWNVATQHPGIAQRIADLRRRAGQDTARPQQPRSPGAP